MLARFQILVKGQVNSKTGPSWRATGLSRERYLKDEPTAGLLGSHLGCLLTFQGWATLPWVISWPLAVRILRAGFGQSAGQEPTAEAPAVATAMPQVSHRQR